MIENYFFNDQEKIFDDGGLFSSMKTVILIGEGKAGDLSAAYGVYLYNRPTENFSLHLDEEKSGGRSAFTWRKRSQAMAVSTRTWGASRTETRRRVVTAIFLWIMRSTHFSSALSGAWQGKPLVRQWSHWWWRRESSMSVENEIMGRAISNRIGAYTHGRTSRADWAAASVSGGILFLPQRTTGRLSLTGDRPWGWALGERMTKESYATISPSQSCYLMLQSKESLKHIEPFITQVMRIKDLDGHT